MRPTAPRHLRERAAGRIERSPAVLVGAVLVAGGVAALLGGVVAAIVAGGYAVIAVRAGARAVAERRAAARRSVALDTISGLAGDLRAGVAPTAALDGALAALREAEADPAVRRALNRISAARTVSERLGAPLADLLDRVEADLRAVERLRGMITAQTAGARASTALLALLPIAGLALGYAMGAQPGHVLQHTLWGAGCVIGTLVLQGTGLAWTSRMCRRAVERAS